MNIIWMDGGLGNQMFQYALALKMQSLGQKVKLDVTKYAEHYAHNGFELATEAEVRHLGYRKANHLTEFIRKTPFRKKTIYNHESYTYDSKVLTLDGYYIEGYWQSERYFADIKEKIKKAYQFPEFSTTEQKAYAEAIKGCCSIGVQDRKSVV